MMELFPWEEAEPGRRAATDIESGAAADAEAAEARPEPAAATSPEESAPELFDAAPDAEEPAVVEPELQPDGDPRERKETDPDAPAAPAPTQPRPQPDAPAPRPGEALRPHGRERPVARKEYYSIGEVSELVGLPAHVLRYWESQFTVLNPSKNRSGNRAYQRKEIRLILLVKHLLYEEKYTVEGAKAKLDQLRRGGALPERTAAALDAQAVQLLREDLNELRALIAGMA
jgi:DNA-binding transcriptional MerR regulator